VNGRAALMSGRCYAVRVPRRVSLPMSSDPRMTLARAREKLGGRVTSHGRGGEIVRLDGDFFGVIVWSDDASCDVWVGEDRIKRIRPSEATRADAAAMLDIAEAARAFAAFEEGQLVVFDSTAGRLIEKCRWGGLVARDDGTIFAVGFRKFVRSAPN